MLHPRRASLLVVVCLFAVPSPVRADGLISWLGRLSGPGPWIGSNVEVCLKSFPTGDSKLEVVPAGFVISCPDSRLEQPHWSLLIGAGAGLAWASNLDYSGQDVTEKDDRVTYLRFGLSAMYTLRPSLDLGAGGGVMVFQGPRFSRFGSPYVQPLRVVVRPLLLRDTSGMTTNQIEARGWLLVTANWMILLDTIDGAKFGAPADPLRERNESLLQLGVSIDLLRLWRAFERERKGIR